MFEFAYNEPHDSTALAELFNREGWEEDESESKLDWAMAASEDWVTCRVEGELVGFGRTYRLDASHKLVFDVVVDERFEAFGVGDEIVRRLALGGSRLQEVAVFRREEADVLGAVLVWHDAGYPVPPAKPDTYVG